jgi:GH24 family phage-related lysozyme (muramidase)
MESTMGGLFYGAPPPPPRPDESSPPPVPVGVDNAPPDDGTVTPPTERRERLVPASDTNEDETIRPKITGRLASVLGVADDSSDRFISADKPPEGRPLPLPPKPRPDQLQTISDAGLQFIRNREVDPKTGGPVLIPKGDGANNPTIGYGHKLRKGELFEKAIDEETAERIFRSDVAEAERAVRRHVTVPLTQGQYDALVSVVYNWGSGHFAKSDRLEPGLLNPGLLKLLNAGDYEAVGKKILEMVYATDQITGKPVFLPGYVPRRQEESRPFFDSGQR